MVLCQVGYETCSAAWHTCLHSSHDDDHADVNAVRVLCARHPYTRGRWIISICLWSVWYLPVVETGRGAGAPGPSDQTSSDKRLPAH